MSKNNLTQEKLKELFSYNPETGFFTRLVTINYLAVAGQTTENKATYKNGYLTICISGKSYLVHRLAFLYMIGEWPKKEVDHINNIRSDNRWINLREATRRENILNRKTLNVLGIKGVSKTKSGKFTANICIGTFETLEEAQEAFNVMANLLHGDFLHNSIKELKKNAA